MPGRQRQDLARELIQRTQAKVIVAHDEDPGSAAIGIGEIKISLTLGILGQGGIHLRLAGFEHFQGLRR